MTRSQPERPLIGQHPSMRRVLRAIERVGPTESSVLILGESGTGKELVARAVHAASPRAKKPLVPINCGAIPAQLLESELFGHVKGAFTGASQSRPGRFELANGGTLFLDEVAEMSPSLQVKLLRVLQERRFEPVGSERTVEVDVRVVAATNRDLEQAIAEGAFREDLYYRLNVVELQLPALRDRADDVPRLADYFNERMGRLRGRQVKRFTDEAMGALCRYGWPGNVRELENIVERLTVFCDDEVVELEDLPAKIVRPRHTRADVPLDLPDEGVDLRAVLQELEERLILQALERTSWNKNRAAGLLGLNRTTLVEKLKKRGMLQGKPTA